MLNIWELFFLFFAFQSLAIGVFFFTKRKGDALSNRILGFFLVLFACNLTYNVLYWSKLLYKIENIHIYGFLAIIWVCYPPLMYLYVRKVIQNTSLRITDLIHLLPAAGITWLFFPFYILSAETKIGLLQSGGVGAYIRHVDLIVPIVTTTMIFYTVLTYFSFRNIQVSLNKKRWFHWVVGSFSCYVLAMLLYFVLSRLGIIETKHDYMIMYVITFFIGLISYFGFKQPQVFEGLPMHKILPFKKYQKTGLTENHAAELKIAITNYFNDQKPFLNSALRLDDVSEKLNLSRHHTSQIINEHFDASFFDFVNTYRIAEAKTLLTHQKELSITDVIFSSGFNNRVSFYKAFKKHTGTTPTAYKKAHS